MPGDFTPPSRFVRAVAFSQSVLQPKTGDEAVLSAFHILNNFDIPRGSAREAGERRAWQHPRRLYDLDGGERSQSEALSISALMMTAASEWSTSRQWISTRNDIVTFSMHGEETFRSSVKSVGKRLWTEQVTLLLDARGAPGPNSFDLGFLGPSALRAKKHPIMGVGFVWISLDLSCETNFSMSYTG